MPLQILPLRKPRTALRPMRLPWQPFAATAALLCATAMACANPPPPAQLRGESLGHQDAADPIRKVNFRSYLLARDGLGDRLAAEFCERDPIRQVAVHYADLIGQGDEQAVVEATTCAMGNGGADITEVFRRLPDGALVSLPLDDGGYRGGDLYAGQRRTPRLEVQRGRLIRWFVRSGDAPTGDMPQVRRTITYRWSRDRFVIDSVKDDAIGTGGAAAATRRAAVPPR